MHKIQFDLNLLKEKVDNSDWEYTSKVLRDNFAVKLDNQNNVIQFKFCAPILDQLIHIFTLQTSNNTEEKHLLETIKALRNSTTNPQSRQYLTDSGIIKTSHLCFPKIPEKCGKVLLQLLINLTIENSGAALKINEIWDLIDLLIEGVFVPETSALLYNISLHTKLKITEDFINHIFLYHQENYNVYLKFLIEKLLFYDDFWDSFKDLDVLYRIGALEYIVEHQIQENKIIFNDKGLDLLSKLFVESSEKVFQQADQNEAYEISLILQILAHVSGGDFLTVLQNNVDLLMQAAILLINIHRLSKQPDNCFTQESKVTDLDKLSLEENSNPVHGFKGNLVRIVGNLCWKCKKMQDLVREAELIPIVLECCNIDMKNPFIMQWSIFTIRNLCENNQENQAFIGAMKKEKDIPLEVLKEVGLTLHSGKEKDIGIVQLDVLKEKLNK